jgi:uncharacterized protein YkwD
VNRKRIVVLVAAAVVVVAGIAIYSVRSSQPDFVTVGDGIALGPSVKHVQSPADLLAQIATGALTTAAGNAGNEFPELGDATPTPQEQALLDMTNADRARDGLTPVVFDAATLRVARVRAAAQIPDGPLSHYNTLGEVAFVGLLGDAGVVYQLAGENLARSSSQDAGVMTRLNDALMNSPTHRANIMEPSFNRLAVGAATGPDGRLAFAEIFRSVVEPDNQATAPASSL